MPHHWVGGAGTGAWGAGPPEKGLVVMEGLDLFHKVRGSLVTLALSQEGPCPRLLARGPGIPGDCPPASPVQHPPQQSRPPDPVGLSPCWGRAPPPRD